MKHFRNSVLTLTFTLSTVIAGQAFSAEEVEYKGQGKSPCSEFITLVDGNWSHPLNALNFHGFMSWAQGMISGYNRYSGNEPVVMNLDEIKLTLVDYCRENPDEKFGDAVKLIISP